MGVARQTPALKQCVQLYVQKGERVIGGFELRRQPIGDLHVAKLACDVRGCVALRVGQCRHAPRARSSSRMALSAP